MQEPPPKLAKHLIRIGPKLVLYGDISNHSRADSRHDRNMVFGADAKTNGAPLRYARMPNSANRFSQTSAELERKSTRRTITDRCGAKSMKPGGFISALDGGPAVNRLGAVPNCISGRLPNSLM
uniref:Uncharacterized protein n=1 Tax=Rhodosorus marinus TaxID=101924 RepID=A0A7S2ZTS7_9RHOD